MKTNHGIRKMSRDLPPITTNFYLIPSHAKIVLSIFAICKNICISNKCVMASTEGEYLTQNCCVHLSLEIVLQYQATWVINSGAGPWFTSNSLWWTSCSTVARDRHLQWTLIKNCLKKTAGYERHILKVGIRFLVCQVCLPIPQLKTNTEGISHQIQCTSKINHRKWTHLSMCPNLLKQSN